MKISGVGFLGLGCYVSSLVFWCGMVYGLYIYMSVAPSGSPSYFVYSLPCSAAATHTPCAPTPPHALTIINIITTLYTFLGTYHVIIG